MLPLELQQRYQVRGGKTRISDQLVRREINRQRCGTTVHAVYILDGRAGEHTKGAVSGLATEGLWLKHTNADPAESRIIIFGKIVAVAVACLKRICDCTVYTVASVYEL